MTTQPTQPWRVLIGSRSFGQVFPEHLAQLAAAGCEVVPNGVGGRAYRAAELLAVLPEMDAIITGTDELTAAVIAAAPRLKTIVKHGVGLETIDLAAARARGIIVSATPGSIHDSVADLTLALILALARKIVPAHLETCAGGWKPFLGWSWQRRPGHRWVGAHRQSGLPARPGLRHADHRPRPVPRSCLRRRTSGALCGVRRTAGHWPMSSPSTHRRSRSNVS